MIETFASYGVPADWRLVLFMLGIAGINLPGLAPFHLGKVFELIILVVTYASVAAVIVSITCWIFEI